MIVVVIAVVLGRVWYWQLNRTRVETAQVPPPTPNRSEPSDARSDAHAETAPPRAQLQLLTVAAEHEDWQSMANFSGAADLIQPATPLTRSVATTPEATTTRREEPAAPPPPVDRPPASIQFQAYVGGLRITGVLQRERVRALIDGRTVFAGDMVDAALGIRLTGADFVARQLVFEDATGAQIFLPY